MKVSKTKFVCAKNHDCLTCHDAKGTPRFPLEPLDPSRCPTTELGAKKDDR